MTLQTPRSRLAARPSLATQNINTSSSPNLSLAASTALARKASLNALTANSPNNMGGDGRELEVGDMVDVPGGMYGVVKFIGSVRGKNGTFAGVELSKDFAVRGKNDGDVDGIRYFTTTIPGSGIFLPVHRASKRASLTGSDTSFPPTPTTPCFANFGLHPVNGHNTYTPPVHAIPKFSQSVGPGVRPPSPLFKAKRPSLPRPESPFRKQPSILPPSRPSLGLTPLSKSQRGGPPRAAASPLPRPPSPGKQRPAPPTRPYSRSASRLSQRGGTNDVVEAAPNAGTRSSDGSRAGTGSAGSAGSTFVAGTRGSADSSEEMAQLRKQLADRDRQLKEQAAQFAEMESSLTELQGLLPLDGGDMGRPRSDEGGDAAQLRAVIREKNEKISMLTSEFDAHRADFRSTIDTLEMASTETARVYEQRVEELTMELRELQEGRDDVESITRQFKQLEELVQELEEGLEDARRGEAEARGEVEFLRGEVERGRSELRRERENSAAALKETAALPTGTDGVTDSRDIEQRDDEIRGLKAIIHSLSSGNLTSPIAEHPSAFDRNGTTPSADPEQTSRLQATLERLEREKKDLQTLVERKALREDELEREIDRLKTSSTSTSQQQRGSTISLAQSDRTVLAAGGGGGGGGAAAAAEKRSSSGRDSRGTILNWRGGAATGVTKTELSPMAENPHSAAPSSNGSGVLWCEICENSGHDILTCASHKESDAGDVAAASAGLSSSAGAAFSGSHSAQDAAARRLHSLSISSQDPDKPRPLAMGLNKKAAVPSPLPAASALPPIPGAAPTAPLPNPLIDLVPGKDGARADPDKWCALCERDGHDSINCAFEDNF